MRILRTGWVYDVQDSRDFEENEACNVWFSLLERCNHHIFKYEDI